MRAYKIFKNVDGDIEFKGLRGRYFYWAIGGGVGTIFLSMFLYVFGLPIIIVLFLLLAGLVAAYFLPHHYNTKNGKWGHIKNGVQEKLPDYVVHATPFKQFIGIKTKQK